jgi:hypothetical protein
VAQVSELQAAAADARQQLEALVLAAIAAECDPAAVPVPAGLRLLQQRRAAGAAPATLSCHVAAALPADYAQWRLHHDWRRQQLCSVQCWAALLLLRCCGLCGAETPLGAAVAAQLASASHADLAFTPPSQPGSSVAASSALLAASCPQLLQMARQAEAKAGGGGGGGLSSGSRGGGGVQQVVLGRSVDPSASRLLVQFASAGFCGGCRAGGGGKDGGAKALQRLAKLARLLGMPLLAALAKGSPPLPGQQLPGSFSSGYAALLPCQAVTAPAEPHGDACSASTTSASVTSASASASPGSWAPSAASHQHMAQLLPLLHCLPPLQGPLPAAAVALAQQRRADVLIAAPLAFPHSWPLAPASASQSSAVAEAQAPPTAPLPAPSPGSLVLLPAHAILLSSGGEFFEALLSERWTGAAAWRRRGCQRGSSDGSSGGSSGGGSGQQAPRVISLPGAPAEAAMLLLQYLYTGGLQGLALPQLAGGERAAAPGAGQNGGAGQAGCCACTALRSTLQLMAASGMLLLPGLDRELDRLLARQLDSGGSGSSSGSSSSGSSSSGSSGSSSSSSGASLQAAAAAEAAAEAAAAGAEPPPQPQPPQPLLGPECLLAALSDAVELGLGRAAEHVAAALVGGFQQVEQVMASPLWRWLPRPVQASLEAAWRQQQRSSVGVLAAAAEPAAGEGEDGGGVDGGGQGGGVPVVVHVLVGWGLGQVVALQHAWADLAV